MNAPQAMLQETTHAQHCFLRSHCASPGNTISLKWNISSSSNRQVKKHTLMRALSIFLLNDSMWVWRGSMKKWKVMAFKKQLFPRKLWPSRRQLFVTPWVCGLLKRKKKVQLSKRKMEISSGEGKRRTFKAWREIPFWDSHEHFSSRTMFPETQSINGEFGLLLFYGMSAKKKKVIYGMFWFGSKLSKSFSFFFSWNSETYLLPFWPKASSLLNLHWAVFLCIPARLLFQTLAQMTECW